MVIIFVILFLLLLIASFFFSGSEAAFLGINRPRFEADLHDGKAGALRVQKLFKAREHILSTLLLGNNLVNNSAAILVTYAIIYFLGEGHTMFALLLLIANITTTFLLLVVGEVFPKIIFKTWSNSILYIIAPLILFFRTIFTPMLFVLIKISDLLLLPFSLVTHKALTYSKADFRSILFDSYEEGVVDEEERHFFETISSLSETRVVEVMTPLADLVLISKSDQIKEILPNLKKTGVEIFPVYSDRIDYIIGYVSFQDIFENNGKTKKNIADFLISTEYIPESATVDSAYELFTKSDNKIFIVVDEYGGCSGVLTEKAIIERIFGFYYTRTQSESPMMIEKLSDSEYVVDTVVDIDDLNNYLEMGIEKDGFETLGGFVNTIFGRIPRVGEEMIWNKITFRVLEARVTAVDKVKIIKQE